MREIKFRSWNPEKKVMTAGHYLNTILCTTDNEFVSDFEKKGGIWMQFTGLHDKNGRERYESDLYELRVTGIDTHVEDILCQVEWSDVSAGFGFHRISTDSEQPEWMAMTDKNILGIKYLGNIHSNPELTKDR
jgi:uncharacterized phage protein (TIGR01671 family)